MTVYVDDPVWKLGRMNMCHMVADSLDELHKMASYIGVAHKHFQDHKGRPHYDICKSKRQQAVFAGAIEVTPREIIAVLRRVYQ